MARDDRTGDLFGHVHGNSEVREKLKAEMRSDASRRAAKTRKAKKRVAETSLEAHDAVKRRKSELHERIIAVLPFAPPGMTADECAAVIGEDKLSVRPRFTELKDDKRIIRLVIDGKPVRRKNASGSAAYVFVRAPQ